MTGALRTHLRLRAYLPLIAAAVAVTALADGCARREPEPVIAQVGDATLTVEDLRNIIPPETLRSSTRNDLQEYINQWVREQLLFQAALTMGYDRDERVEERAEEAHRGIVVDVFLEDELDLQPFIAESQIEEYYRNNADTFIREQDERAVEILWFERPEEGEAARRAALEGRTFSNIAADTSFGNVEADLEAGYLTRQELGEDLGETVFALDSNDLSDLVRVGGGYALVRVVDRQEQGSTRTLEEVRNEIIMRQTSDLWEMKLDELLQRLLEQSSVSINAEAGSVLLDGGSEQR